MTSNPSTCSTMDAAPAEVGACEVATGVGARPQRFELWPQAGIEWKADGTETLWSVAGEGSFQLCLRGLTLPAGWYELSGQVDCVDGVVMLPGLRYGFEGSMSSAKTPLPAPGADGQMRALLLFERPVSQVDLDLGISPARFHLRDVSLRRISRLAALRHMLGQVHVGDTTARRLRRGLRFARQAWRSGLSRATTTLFRDYASRLRVQGLANYQLGAGAEPALSGPDAGVADNDEPLTPFLIDTGLRPGVVSAALDARRWEQEYRLLAGSGLFDARHYLRNNPDVARSGLDPLLHFCQYGWRGLRNPSPGFDVWWYWSMHLDPAQESINPLVHYALIGKDAGLETRPPPYRPAKGGHVYNQGSRIRRICLFAGYDADGRIDDYVLTYLRELGRHADIYYLADNQMRPGELEKLDGLVKGAWDIRHGAYDFGSYSMLARELVGWETIEQYDELILTNDSGYLLKPLDDVFARMDARPCDWWGLQATKGLMATRRKRSNRFRQPIPMTVVKEELLPAWDNEYVYDFHVGSYFWTLRKPVLRDAGFRRLLDSVARQSLKLNIIRKYEIGLGRYLTASNFAFDTFIEQLFPFHPIYSERAFELVAKGFPFFKRYFLTQNHYRVPGLLDWKERLRRLVPDAPIEQMERNLLRASNYEKLYGNLRIEAGRFGRAKAPRLLHGDAFTRADEKYPKRDDWWAFPTCAFTHAFSGNERAVFEAIRHDPSITKVVLARKKHIDVDGENVIVVPLRSVEGQQYLMRSKQIFIKHSPTRNLVFPVSSTHHNLINLWHGIPLKRIGYASLDMQHQLEAIAAEHEKCRAVISSSKVDTLAMASAFYPLSYNDVWLTGLPRNDFILRDREALPEDMRMQVEFLRALLQGRRLVLFVPTFKQSQGEGYYRFTDDELAILEDLLQRNNAVLGVREHMADRARTYNRMFSQIGAINVGDYRFPNIEVLYREAAVLVTDYSSCFIDFMLTGRPMVSFAYDYDNYVNRERGLFYDMDFAFPGPVCKDFEQLRNALEQAFEAPGERAAAEYEWKRRLFFDYHDDSNASRVVEKVKALYQEGAGQLPRRAAKLMQGAKSP